jgi:hypothetical protein
MAKSDFDRARFVGALAVYLGLVVATVVVGGLVGWVMQLAVDGRLSASPSPLSRSSYASDVAPADADRERPGVAAAAAPRAD